MIFSSGTRLQYLRQKFWLWQTLRQNAAAAWCEARQFDWRQLLHPARAGHWPLMPRMVFLLVFSVFLCVIAMISNAVVMPELTEQELAVPASLQQRIDAQVAQNIELSARLISQRQQHLILYPLLQGEVSEAVDIARAMELVRNAATGTDVQQLMLSPHAESADLWYAMRLQAHLPLSALLLFWSALSETPLSVRVNNILMTNTTEQNQFALIMELSVQTVKSPAAESLYAVPADFTDKPGYMAPSRFVALRKGFIWRSGSHDTSVLVQDENGRLSRTEMHVNRHLPVADTQ